MSRTWDKAKQGGKIGALAGVIIGGIGGLLGGPFGLIAGAISGAFSWGLAGAAVGGIYGAVTHGPKQKVQQQSSDPQSRSSAPAQNYAYAQNIEPDPVQSTRFRDMVTQSRQGQHQL